MTDEQRVKEKWPDAWVQQSKVFRIWTVYAYPFPSNVALGEGNGPSAAWSSAAGNDVAAVDEARKK